MIGSDGLRGVVRRPGFWRVALGVAALIAGVAFALGQVFGQTMAMMFVIFASLFWTAACAAAGRGGIADERQQAGGKDHG